MSLDRIKIGTSVRVTHQPARDHGYVESSRGMRQTGDGLTGVTVAEHDGHGLCYEVRIGKILITYDREELEIVSPAEALPVMRVVAERKS